MAGSVLFRVRLHGDPRIDDVARRGLSLSNAYAASPVCSPSRASLLSGKYPARVGVTQYIGGHTVGRLADVPYFRELPQNEFSLARALKAGGYRTWHVGKWHLGEKLCWPENHGFDVNIGGCDLGHPPSYWSPYGIPNLPDGPDGEYLTDRLTDEAVRLIKEPGDEPFFLNLWHYAVHTPIQAPADLVAKYERKAADMRRVVEPLEAGEHFPTWEKSDERVMRRTIQSHPGYAAMIENLDTNVGRVIDALAEAGTLDNTVVIFTSDNGGLSTAEGSPTTNLPLAEGKGWMADGGVRVPFIVTWPKGELAGGWSESMLTSPDLYPTLLTVAGLDQRPEQHIDGSDVLDHWKAGRGDRGPVFWHYPHYSNQGDAGVRRPRRCTEARPLL
ncbi:hypothetical protein GCM10025865_14920 [Paraoerskovia sediminicola]|uniref:Sulfatase N-terminal domain-containing protein n=1 Tax=Paraoerskovia sediminicola TaxID=1138587 RepID=A0ABN6XB73_9CELL|nr:sulfatase [Paraoerskovia sediminicola]BDZ42193.1 hypothetical protein GCM10025865_14920 [Paraoerskovia sediminicola]